MTRSIVYPALAAVLALSCYPGVEPLPQEPSTSRSEPHFVQWRPVNGSLNLTAVGAVDVRRVTTGRDAAELSLNEIALDSYQASFWAVRGKDRRLQLNYVSPGGTSPFMTLEIDDPVLRPDGSAIANGDSVLITVIVDPVNIRVDLEPSGLQFGDPAEFRMWWTGAEGDLNGDGVVDALDAEIENRWLGLWYQEGTQTPWTPIPAEKSLEEQRLRAYLKHFSGYAVSW